MMEQATQSTPRTATRSTVSIVHCRAYDPSEIADSVPIDASAIVEVADFAQTIKADLTVVGPELPMVLGIGDEFVRRGLRIFCPSRGAAEIEGSKAFAREFMTRHKIPSPRYEVCGSLEEALAFVKRAPLGYPFVVKADGLAAGKGTVVVEDAAEAKAVVEQIMGEKKFGSAGAKVVMEEFLEGEEVSFLVFSDGSRVVPMASVQDHKRALDGDKGPNTGGMGTITDASLLTDDQTSEIVETVIKPTLEGCVAEGFPFRGILFLGLMMTPEGPKVLEYNVRFGDPETQAILVRLQTDLVDVCEAMIAGTLDGTKIEWLPGSSACVILAAEGYPSKPRTGDVIEGLGEAAKEPDVTVFHAGTTLSDSGDILTAGGRVVGVTATGHELTAALDKAYAAAGKISWPGMQYRKDIGK